MYFKVKSNRPPGRNLALGESKPSFAKEKKIRVDRPYRKGCALSTKFFRFILTDQRFSCLFMSRLNLRGCTDHEISWYAVLFLWSTVKSFFVGQCGLGRAGGKGWIYPGKQRVQTEPCQAFAAL
jgi:hypothetical protein